MESILLKPITTADNYQWNVSYIDDRLRQYGFTRGLVSQLVATLIMHSVIEYPPDENGRIEWGQTEVDQAVHVVRTILDHACPVPTTN